MNKLYCIFLVLFISIQLTHAQRVSLFSRPYTPTFLKGSIRSFLDDINQHSPTIIEYSANFLDTGKVIILTGSPETIGAVLHQVLESQKINLVEKNNKFIITPAAVPLPENFFISWYSVYGIIKEDVSGEPLADATIWQPAQQRGSYSNNHGYFTIKLPEGTNELYLSYAGYETHRIEVNLKGNT